MGIGANHEPLRVPAEWRDQERGFVRQVEDLFSRLFAKLNNLIRKTDKLDAAVSGKPDVLQFSIASESARTITLGAGFRGLLVTAGVTDTICSMYILVTNDNQRVGLTVGVRTGTKILVSNADNVITVWNDSNMYGVKGYVICLYGTCTIN